MKNKNEAIVIRHRGGKLAEVRIIPHRRKQERTKFVTDNVIEGSMETKSLPDRFNSLVEWLDKSGKLSQVEQMMKFIFQQRDN